MKWTVWLVMLLMSLPAWAAEPIGGRDGKLQSIKLLSNRFRMDAGIEEVTFVIQRRPGSAPVILVRPDGSKLYYLKVKSPMKWMAGNTGDMIKIPTPMAGPWQIIGDILPGSEVHLASDLELTVADIPEELFVGEKIKLTAKLMIDNKLLELGRVDDLVKLLLQITSLNIAEDANFGVGRLTVGEFLDNGIGFDEKVGDGVFTGELDLEKPLGHYELTVTASNKAFTREYRQPLLLRPQPVKATLRSSDDGQSHTLKLVTNAKVANFTRQLVQIQLKHPDLSIEELSITDVKPTHLLPLTSASAPGRYQLKMQVAGETNQGRNFMMELPPIKFNIDPPAVPVVIDEPVVEAGGESLAAVEVADEETGWSTLTIILLVNGLVIVLGILFVWLYWRKFRKPKVENEGLPEEIAEDKA